MVRVLPEPYYRDRARGIVLYCGSAFDILPELGPGAAGICLTDPPYDAVTHKGGRRNAGNGVIESLIHFEPFTERELRESLRLVAGVTERWVIATIDWRHMLALETLPPAGLRFVRFGVWDKVGGAPQFSGDRPATGWEAVAILHRVGGQMRWNGGGHRAVWRANLDHQKVFATQKPVALLKKLLLLFSEPGETVLDCFAGSGSSLVAAAALGRPCVGIERDAATCEIAVRRLGQSAFCFDEAPVAASPAPVQIALDSVLDLLQVPA